jgi:uncharacterized protein with von Willebrand factor type A (vWA) domain
MKHLKSAVEQMDLIDGKDMNEDIRRTQISQSYAMIVIAEELNLANQISNKGSVSVALDKIAEQLERLNNKLDRIAPTDSLYIREDK